MKTNILATRPLIPQEYTLTAFNNNKSRPNKSGVLKLLPPPPPPDEKRVMELNALAANHPFCVLHKAKRHDPL
jgi:hypothetical protein